MKKSITIKVETETEDRDVISLCYINEKTIALEISDIARTMFRKNKPLFDKLNNSTRLLGGALYRQEVTKPLPNSNSLSTRMLNSYDYVEKEISQLYFEENVLRRQQRAISKLGRKFDFDPKKISSQNTGGGFDPKNLSLDDVNESEIICTVEEISLFQNQGIKTILITDTLNDVKSILEVGYRIEVAVDTEFRDYLNYVIRQAENSLTFLTAYSESLFYPQNYNAKMKMFTEEFREGIMSGLGLSGSMKKSLTSPTVKNSQFGKVATSLYNLSLLLSSGVNDSIYSKALQSILPTGRTSPKSVDSFLRKYSSLLEVVKKEYGVRSKQIRRASNSFSRISEGKVFQNSIQATTVEKFSLEQEKLGYSVFSDKQKGLNKFSASDYNRRISAERAKYYPSINLADDSSFLTPSEKSEFLNMSNAVAFLTPTSLIMGDDRIKTNRGMRNMPINKIREFRLAKSSRAQQLNSTRNPVSYSRAQITNNVMASFNVVVSKPTSTILSRSFDENLDPLIDAKNYLGEDSLFVTDNPAQLKKQFKRLVREEDRKILGIVSDIVPRRFLRNKRAIKSIKEIQFSNPKSKIRRLATAQELRISEIPPHVKFMMSKNFNPNPNSDPLKNNESRQIIEETQKNLFLIKALTGFEKDADGFLDIKNPIYKQIESSDFSSGKSVLAKAYDYEIPELGIVKDKFAPTIYNNLIYIRG